MMETAETQEESTKTSGNASQEKSLPQEEETLSILVNTATEDGTDTNASNTAYLEAEKEDANVTTSKESKIPPPSVSPKTEHPSDQAQISPPVINTITNTNPKVKIHFIAVGSAPLMKKSKFQIPGKEPFGSLQLKMRKMLQLTDSSQLFLYLHQSFVPSPEDLVGDLGDLFCVRGELKIHYSLQEAWG